MFARALHVESVPQDIYSTKWVTISGTEYRAGLIICSEIEHEMSVFCRIKKILVVDSVIYFLVNKSVVDHFSEHFHAYQVFESDEKDVIKADSLVIYKPFDLQSAYGGGKASILYHYFLCKCAHRVKLCPIPMVPGS